MECALHKSLILLRRLPFYPAIQAKAKYALLDVSLAFLGAAFEVVSQKVPELKNEIADWADGRKFALGVLPKGPYITLEKRGDEVYYLGKGLQSPDVTFLFKNFDAGVPVFAGLKSSHLAMAEAKILIQGNLVYAMEVNRALAIVLAYLFPVTVFKHLFKAPPKLGLAMLINKAKVQGALTPTFIKHMISSVK
jgi:hypothetical protein